MNIFVRLGVVVGLLVGMTAGQAHAVDKNGTIAVKWLTFDVDARQAAVGSAATAYSDFGAFSVLVNPAGMVFAPGKSAAFNYLDLFAGQSYFSGAAVYNMGDRGAVGIGLVVLSSNDIPFTTSTDPTHQFATAGKNFTVTGIAIGPSYARRLTDAFSVGATIKYISENTNGAIGFDKRTDTVAFDLGTLYTTDFHKFRVGATFTNFGPDLRFIERSDNKQQLPTTFRIGFAGDPAALPVGSLTLSTEVWKQRELDSVLNFGAEYQVIQNGIGFAVRGGFKAGFKDQDGGGTFGAGVKFEQGGYKIHVDYAFQKQSALDNLNRVSVGIGF